MFIREGIVCFPFSFSMFLVKLGVCWGDIAYSCYITALLISVESQLQLQE